MKISEFYKRYNDMVKEERFSPINISHVTSAFIVYKELEGVRAQLRYFERRQEELLHQAEII